MIRRLVDDTVLGGFSILFRLAVFALKQRHISQVSTALDAREAVVNRSIPRERTSRVPDVSVAS